MRKVIIVPARYKSSRFEGKPLAMIAGIPMIVRVCNRLLPVGADIVVATDDKRIFDVVMNAGFRAKMTGECDSGTDRVFQCTLLIPDYDIYVNVQGDEPLVNPDDILKMIKVKERNMGDIIGAMAFIKEGEKENPDIVKVVVDQDNMLKQITRLPVKTIYRQNGIYVYTKQQLSRFVNSQIPERERIELTKAEDCIRMVVVKGSHSVDRKKDIKIIEEAICRA